MLKKILNTFGTKALTAGINLLVAIILSQYLGPEGKGVQSLILTTITLVLVFANLVGGATLVYLTPRKDQSLLVVPAYCWTIVTALLAFLILRTFPIIDEAFILHVCLLSVLNSIAAIHASILIGKERIQAANFIGLLQPLALILTLFGMFAMPGQSGIKDYIYSLYLSFGLSAAVSLLFYHKYCGKIRLFPIRDYLEAIPEMIRLGFLNQVAHITQMLSFRLSYYVIQRFHGEAAVGIYSNGISIAESIWLISKSISLVQYARISNTADRKESGRLTMRLASLSLGTSFLILFPILLLPESFFAWMFGPGFENTRLVIWALAPGVLIYNLPILVGHYFSGTGRYYINAVSSLVGLLASLALYFTIIPEFGITGAAWATSLSYLVTTLVLMIFFHRENKGWAKEMILKRRDWKRFRELISGNRDRS